MSKVNYSNIYTSELKECLLQCRQNNNAGLLHLGTINQHLGKIITRLGQKHNIPDYYHEFLKAKVGGLPRGYPTQANVQNH